MAQPLVTLCFVMLVQHLYLQSVAGQAVSYVSSNGHGHGHVHHPGHRHYPDHGHHPDHVHIPGHGCHPGHECHPGQPPDPLPPWQQPIHYGSTRIRIKHKETDQYLEAGGWQSRMSPATLTSGSGDQFILYNSRSGIKVRTMNPVYRGYDYMTLNPSGQVHFTRNSWSWTQHWVVSKTTHLLDEDEVTLKNKGNGGGLLLDFSGQLTAEASADGDEWILEAA